MKRALKKDYISQGFPSNNWSINRKWLFDHYYKCKWWRERSKEIRDKHPTCQRCKACPSTEVHHLNYLRLGRERSTDLRALCHGCHMRIHEEKQATVKRRIVVRWPGWR